MQKLIWVIGIIAVLAVGIVAAQGYGRMGELPIPGMGMQETMHESHTSMMNIMESGTYEEFVALKESTGMPMMPWIEDKEDFVLMQQMHQKMQTWRAENGGMRGGCPMMR